MTCMMLQHWIPEQSDDDRPGQHGAEYTIAGEEVKMFC